MPWTAIVGMRHRLVHDYLNVDEDAVWSTVVEDIQPLVAQLEAVMAELV